MLNDAGKPCRRTLEQAHGDLISVHARMVAMLNADEMQKFLNVKIILAQWRQNSFLIIHNVPKWLKLLLLQRE